MSYLIVFLEALLSATNLATQLQAMSLTTCQTITGFNVWVAVPL
jgi:hypothetical protein